MARRSRRLRAIPDRNRVNVSWLIRLRWAEVTGQASTVLAVETLFGVRLPVVALTAVVAIGLVSNLALELHYFGLPRRDERAMPPVREWQLAAVMALDVALLTALLYLTGGPLNPFGFLYLVQIALATVLLPARWSWAMVAMSFGGFGLLLVDHEPLPIPDDTRMYGMWVALGVASAFVAHFLFRITGALAQREHELAEARNLTARQERLASLATMAAGAAHELSTPLSTVALVAKELERHLVKTGDPQLVDDARLIREQVGRCRVILDQMAGGAGAAGEGVETRTVDDLLDETLTGVRPSPPIERRVAPAIASLQVRLPPRAVSQALRSLVTNAQDASPAEQPVVVAVRADDDDLVVVISDRGAGMSPEVQARIGEPFYTTKQPGRGMGLGFFLARAVIENVDGNLAIDSRIGDGTRITVTVPIDVQAEPRGASRRRPSTGPTAGAGAAPSEKAQLLTKVTA
jgi:two-component system sensor histidine kinase RegB